MRGDGVVDDEVGSVLADRLNELFSMSRPRGRPWTNDEVATEIKKSAPEIKVSGAYLSALRSGKRRQPSRDLLVALARFFGVSPAYFFDSGQADRVNQQLAALDELRQAGVRSVALRAVGLPPEILDAVTAILDQMRRLQGLPAVDEDRGERDSDPVR
jgi:transcriptional regulator with XRE-family HTH domain